MKHVPAMLIKLAFITAINALVLMPMMGVTFRDTLWLSVILTVVLYVLGDMVILPAWGNGAAMAADAGVALLLLWLAPRYTQLPAVPFVTALIAAAIIGLAEYFFHGWLQHQLLSPAPAGGGEDRT